MVTGFHVQTLYYDGVACENRTILPILLPVLVRGGSGPSVSADSQAERQRRSHSFESLPSLSWALLASLSVIIGASVWLTIDR
eukprot:scaffold246_cov242-Pinguiococcus_pyrenoidosus.AAC.20